MMDRLLENNTVLKILSVIVAIFIWIQAGAASSQPAINRPMGGVAVGYHNLSPHLTVLSISPSVVTVTINGQPGAVSSSSVANEVSALTNLGNITKPGTYSLKVSGAVPQGIGVASVTPNRVTVTIAQMGQQKVPVVLQIAGSPAPGYELMGYKSSLQQATISGPTNALNQVRSVVGTLSLGSRENSFTAQVVLHPVNADGQVVPKVQVNPPTASVSLTIQLRPPEKVLPVVGQLTGTTPSGYRVSQINVYPSSVTLSGPKSTLSALNHVYTAPVSVTGAKSSFTKLVPVVVPKGASLVSSGEATVTVTIVSTG